MMAGRAWDLKQASGWRSFVDAPAYTRPEKLTMTALLALSEEAREDYADLRTTWHGNFGILQTPQLLEAHSALDLIVSTNKEDSDRTRGSAVLDALPGLGKTTMVNEFAKHFERGLRRRFGERTERGDLRIPVARVGLSAQTTLKSLNFQIASFYRHPGVYTRISADRLADISVECALRCETKVVIIDDLHRIDPTLRGGRDVTEHLKRLADDLPVTFIYIGVGLRDRRMYSEGLSGHRAALAQTGRRWTRIEVEPFHVREADDRKDWLRMIRSTERALVLLKHSEGSLEELGDYFFDRTGGYIGSFFTLIRRGCRLAITSGQESITRELLDRIRIDEAAEALRLDRLRA